LARQKKLPPQFCTLVSKESDFIVGTEIIADGGVSQM
jgi:hypothetical protein